MNPDATSAQVKITFSRALKMWWGFLWRATLLNIPVSFFALPVAYFLFPHTPEGEMPFFMKPHPLQTLFESFALFTLVMIVIFILMQVLALWWMTKARWSDFRIVAVAPVQPLPQNEASPPLSK